MVFVREDKIRKKVYEIKYEGMRFVFGFYPCNEEKALRT